MLHNASALLDNLFETTFNSLYVSCSKWSVEHAHEIWPHFAEHSVRFIYTRTPTECLQKFSAHSECMHLCIYMPIRYGSMKFIMWHLHVTVYIYMSKCEYLCLITISRLLIFAGELLNWFTEWSIDNLSKPLLTLFPCGNYVLLEQKLELSIQHGRHLKLQLCSTN